MSHTTEDVKRYVCLNCNSVMAGDVAGGSGESHTFSAPDECAACGNDDIVQIGEYPHEAE
jgi:hypothetical protein